MNGESINDRPGRNIQIKDPGELENRLSLSPNTPEWQEFLGSWRDGEEYTLTVKVRQVSPGEFEVIDANPAAEGTEEAAETPAGDEDAAGGSATGETMSDGGSSPVNPAVAKMMSGAKY